MKKILQVFGAALLLALSVCAAVACESVTGISFEKENMPRLTYVLGQDLDLTSGKLTVAEKKGSQEISLDAEGVEISGFDKNTLGKQEVTITYHGQTAKLTVEVVRRIRVENAETQYLMGESFHREKGVLHITRDDGTSFSVEMKDEAVTVEQFDSSSAGQKTVKLRYQKDGEDYSDEFTVEVVQPEDVRFNPPVKSIYRSHESGIDVTGGYFTFVVGGQNRYFTLTEDMISGFDLSQATEANRTEPLVQTVTARYAGVEKTFTVNIYYSDVSYVGKLAGTLRSVDWTGSTLPEIGETEGEAALLAARLYFGLEYDERVLVSEEDAALIAKTAAVYGNAEWAKLAQRYSRSFVVEDGAAVLVGESAAAVAEDYAALAADTRLAEISDLLEDINRRYADLAVLGETTLSQCLQNSLLPDALSGVLSRLEYMSELHESLSKVPATWSKENLEDYSDALDKAIGLLTYSPYTSVSDRELYSIVSSWRENDDFFDILYEYAYLTKNATAARAMGNFRLPGRLEDLYNTMLNGLAEIIMLNMGQRVDTTFFMLCYDDVENLIDEVLAEEDSLYSWLYETLAFTFGDMFTQSVSFEYAYLTLRQETMGYFYHADALLDDPDYENLWSQYLAIIRHLEEDEGYEDTPEFDSAVDDLFTAFAALTPSRIAGFLNSVNPFLREGTPILAFDLSEGAYTLFAYCFGHRYADAMSSEEGTDAIFGLLVAMETYARQFEMDELDGLFYTIMEQEIKYHDALEGSDKAFFEEHFESTYQKYKEIYEIDRNSTAYLGDWKTTFNELISTLESVYDAGMYTFYFQQYGMDPSFQSAVFAAYERARGIVEYILEEAPEHVVESFYYDRYSIDLGGGSVQEWTLDYAWYTARSYFVNLYDTFVIGNYYLYDMYDELGLAPFLSAAYDVLYPAYCKMIGDTVEYEKDKVLAAMEAYRELDPFAMICARELDGFDLYQSGILSFLSTEFEGSETLVQTAYDLLEVEWAFAYYSYDPDGAVAIQDESGGSVELGILEYLHMMLDSLSEDYTALGEEQAAFDAILLEMYTYYTDLCAGLPAAPEAE